MQRTRAALPLALCIARRHERRHGLPSADRGAEPQEAVARVVRLLRVLGLRRLPRHRVQRDPRGRRADRRVARSSSTACAGRDATRLVDRVITRDATKLAVGQVYYTPWCDEHGKVIDDGTVHRLDDGSYRWTAADPQLRWLRLNARRARRRHRRRDRADRRARPPGPAARGPSSRRRPASRSPTCATSGARRDRIGRASPVDVSRTGYTGDLGYELWIPVEHAVGVWDALMEAGSAYGIRPAGHARPRRRAARGRPHPARGRLHVGPPRHEPRAELLARSRSGSGGWSASTRATSSAGWRSSASSGPAARRAGSSACSSTGTTSRACTAPRACRPRSRPLSIARRSRSSRAAARSARRRATAGARSSSRRSPWRSVPPRHEPLGSRAGGGVDGRGPPRPGRGDAWSTCRSSTCPASAPENRRRSLHRHRAKCRQAGLKPSCKASLSRQSDFLLPRRGEPAAHVHRVHVVSSRRPCRRGRSGLNVRRAVSLAFLAAICSLTATAATAAHPPATPSSLDPGAFRAVEVAEIRSRRRPRRCRPWTTARRGHPSKIGAIPGGAAALLRAAGKPGSARSSQIVVFKATPRPNLPTPRIDSAARQRYCKAGVSACASGYPGGLYAAAGPALRVGDWRGRTVTVCGSGNCVNVKLIDWCACGSGRVIDLYSDASAGWRPPPPARSPSRSPGSGPRAGTRPHVAPFLIPRTSLYTRADWQVDPRDLPRLESDPRAGIRAHRGASTGRNPFAFLDLDPSAPALGRSYAGTLRWQTRGTCNRR